jgi:hypothetical protein
MLLYLNMPRRQSLTHNLLTETDARPADVARDGGIVVPVVNRAPIESHEVCWFCQRHVG